MKKVKVTFAAALAAWLMTVAMAQEQKALPPQSVFRGALRTAQAEMAPQSHKHNPPANLFFCPSRKCLYYAGDCDSTSSNTNALFDFENPGIGVSDAEVWVGVKPTRNATVTGASGNYDTNTSTIGINPTPFAVRTGVSAGNPGKLVCSTSGNAVVQNYGQCFIEGSTVNYYIAKLAKGCHLKAKKTYFIDLTPQYNDGSTIGYLWDIVEKKPVNHKGWPNVVDDSFFNSSSFGVNFEPTWGTSGACGGIGCDGFSMSLTGKEE